MAPARAGTFADRSPGCENPAMVESSHGSGGGAAAPDWIQPAGEQEGLRRYVETLRERVWVVVAVTALTTLVAIVYVLVASKQYSAEADLLVTPISSSDTNVLGLPLIRESSDPTRDVETASRLVTNSNVAARVSNQLGGDPRSLLNDVSAQPVATSNIVAVSATAGSPGSARDLANAFATQAVSQQTAALHAAIDSTLPGLQSRLRSLTDPGAAGALQSTVAELESLRSGTDPTIHIQTLADAPTAPSSPKTLLSVAAGLVGGLVLGVVAAFALQVLDPRLRREEQLRRLYRLPILARIPRESRGATGKPLNPVGLSPATGEAYRTLRGLLSAQGRGGSDSRAILVTGSSPSEGKTTTAVNLASSLAASGNSVILVEADLRRPAIGEALETKPSHGVVSVLIESMDLESALVTTPLFGSRLGLLLADYEGGWISELFALPAARELVEHARGLADYVIIDSPPLTDVIDALPLATYVDDVLIVVRLGKTHLGKLTQLGELLAENGVRPVGFAVIGTPRPSRSDYHYYADRQDRALHRGGNGVPQTLLEPQRRLTSRLEPQSWPVSAGLAVAAAALPGSSPASIRRSQSGVARPRVRGSRLREPDGWARGIRPSLVPRVHASRRTRSPA